MLQPALLPLSHYSPASKMALPQVVQAGAVGKAGLVQNLSQYVYIVSEKGAPKVPGIGVVVEAVKGISKVDGTTAT